MSKKLFTKVYKEKIIKPSIHKQGLPNKLSGEVPISLKYPDFLIIDIKSVNNIFLLRFDSDGREITDTWHLTIQEAKNQATYEYGNAIEEWEEIPDKIDFLEFSLNKCKTSK